MQEMDEQRIRHLAKGYCQFSDIEKKVLPIISKCLDGITAAGNKIDEKQVGPSPPLLPRHIRFKTVSFLPVKCWLKPLQDAGFLQRNLEF